MTGEMYKSDVTEEEYPLHFAIAKALGGTVEPFDVYQGPYVVIGADIRCGNGPYAMAPRGFGIARLWICDDEKHGGTVVYNEANEKSSPFWPYGPGATRQAIKAARKVTGIAASRRAKANV